MMMRAFAVGVVCAAALGAQSKKFNWQNYCFDHPSAVSCKGHDYAVPPPPPAKNDPPGKTVVRHPLLSSPKAGSATMVNVGGIDWRFADPFADALVGIDFSGISESQMARGFIAQLGANQGLNAADMQKLFDGLAGVDQVAMSVRNKHVVVMITGRVTETELPPPQPGLKVAPVTGGALLVGHADAVDQALQRINQNQPPSETARAAALRQAANHFWAEGSPALAGPQALSAGMKRFSIAVSMRDRWSSDLAFQFNGAPDAATLRNIETSLGGGVLEGDTVHVRTSLAPEEMQQKFNDIAASPLGEQLGMLVQSARYLPTQAPPPQNPKPAKAVIYGLDDGPRVVN